MDTHRLWRIARVIGSTSVVLAALGLPGCAGGYIDVDGYDAAYVAPPVGIEAYPRYSYGGADVYDVDGRYYRRHEGRWVQYHNVPPDVARWHERNRGRAEPQRR